MTERDGSGPSAGSDPGGDRGARRRRRRRRRSRRAPIKLADFLAFLTEGRSKSRRRHRHRGRHKSADPTKRAVAVGDFFSFLKYRLIKLRRRRRRSTRPSRWRAAFAIGTTALAGALISVAIVFLVPRYSTDTYEDAIVRFNSGEYRSAIIALKNVLQRDPDDLSARMLIGRAYLKIGFARAAEDELRRARMVGADEDLVRFPLALAYLQQGKYEQLLSEFPAVHADPGQRARVLVMRGQALIRLRRLDEAAEALRSAASLRPGDPEPLIGLAQVRLGEGAPVEAEDLIDRATGLAPDNAEAWYVKAEIRRARSDMENALRYYGQALDADPLHVTARLARAALRIDAGEEDAALEDLRSVWAVRPEDPQAYYLYALILSKQNEPDKAQKMLDRASLALTRSRSEFVERHAPSLLLLGVIHLRNNRLQEATDNLERYLAIDPMHAGARKLIATAYLRRDLPTAAIDALRPVERFAGKDPELLALLGQAHMHNSDPARAAGYLQRAAAIVPDSVQLRTQFALTKLALGRDAEAVRDLESVLGAGSEAVRAGNLLGMLQLRQGDLQGALRTAGRVIEQEPASASAYNMRGAVQLAMRNLPEARASFERAVELDPGYVTALHNLAKLDLAQGKPEAAKARYDQILERRPEDTQAMVELSKFARAHGRDDEAIRHLEKARAVDPTLLGPQLDLIELYMRGDNAEQARYLVQELESRFPKSVAVAVARGRFHLATGETDKATSTFRRLAQGQQDSPENLLRIARYQLGSGDLVGAGETLAQILSTAPDFVPARVAQVELDLRSGTTDAALERADALRRDRPELAVGERLMGDVQMSRERPGEAAQHYLAAMRKGATGELALRLYAARRATGKVDVAVRELGEWVEKNPADLEAQRILAAGYLAIGEVRRAVETHERLLREYPNDGVLLNNLAALYLKSGDGRALDVARQAYAAAPKEPAVLDTLGWVLVQRGQPAEALKYLREAHLRASRDAVVRYHIAVALNRLGRNVEARQELEAALAADADFEEAAEARRLLASLGG